MSAFGYGTFKGAKGAKTPDFLGAEIAQSEAEDRQKQQKNTTRQGTVTAAADLGMQGYENGLFGGDVASTVGSTTPAPISTAVPIDPLTGTAPMSEALLSSAASTAAPTGAIVGGGGTGSALAAATEGASLAAGSGAAAGGAAAAGGFGATAMAAMPYLAPLALALQLLG
jgi:hypothetical protein